MTRNKVYVSGPMTGYPNHNFPMFENVSAFLRAEGHEVLGAHEIVHADGGEAGSITWEEYLRGDLIGMLQECDSIALLPGWPKSKGAVLELTVAQALGFVVYSVVPMGETFAITHGGGFTSVDIDGHE